MLNNPHIKPTQSFLYFENDIDKNSKVSAFVDQAFLKFNKNKTGYMDKKQFIALVKYGYSKGVILKGKLTIQGLIAQLDRTWKGPMSKKQVFQFILKYFQQPNNQNHPNPKTPQNFPQKPSNKQVYNKLIHEILPIKNHQKTQKLKLSQKCHQIFIKYDSNKTGFLDYNQLTNLLKNQFQNKYSYFDCLKICDKNKDGLISENQLFVFYQKIYQ